MSDRAAVALALLAALGARLGVGPPVVIAAVGLGVALLARRPWLLCIAALALTGARGAADTRGLAAAPTGPFDGWVELTTDPIDRPGGAVTVDGRIDGHLVALTARGRDGTTMRERAAGDVVRVKGERRRVPPTATWLSRRHIGVQLTVTEVGEWQDGRWPWRVANMARDALERSAHVLPERQRGLYLGLVLGDDRAEPADIADDFRGAGLAHLLAVSGQNVASVLALAAPLLRRTSLSIRVVVVVGVLGLFVLATRAEPSVLRAAAMAAIAAVAAALGREASGLRVLSLAVAGLLVADPFLVRSLGFQLSVAASAAILLLARPLARRVPGPRPLAEAVSVSIAAQAGVAPVLAMTLEGAPVVGLVANVLAAPAAGPVMAWGMVAGLAGGALGPAASTVLHLPTRLLVGWLVIVARTSARLPLGHVGMSEIAALAFAVAVVVAGRRVGARWAAPVGGALAVAALVTPALGIRWQPAPMTALGRGAVLWRGSGTVLVVDGRAQVDDVLSGLREAGVTAVDLVVVRTDSTATASVLDALSRRGDVGEVIRPPLVSTTGERQVGDLTVLVRPGGSGLVVDVRAAE